MLSDFAVGSPVNLPSCTTSLTVATILPSKLKPDLTGDPWEVALGLGESCRDVLFDGRGEGFLET